MLPAPPRPLRTLALAALLLLCGQAGAAPALPALNIDLAETSISGISSGGFMSVQFQVAHAAMVKGAGIIAGGPYYCARDQVEQAVARCSCTGEPSVPCQVSEQSANIPALVEATHSAAAAGHIDAPRHLARQRVITVSGARDKLVPPPIARQLGSYYTAMGVPSAQFSAVELPQAAHTMPTRDYGIACSAEKEPYIGKCDYDSAGAILGWIYGNPQAPGADPGRPESWLQPRHEGQPRGRFMEFDQKAHVPGDSLRSFLWGSGMDSTGWVYVPEDCARGEPCRLHIALHGCKQGQSYLPLTPPPGGGLYNGTTFVRNTGYDRWADNNRLVILYPQAVSIPLLNPNGCWDWWGYTGDDYANRQGVQIRALRAMAERLAAGYRRP